MPVRIPPRPPLAELQHKAEWMALLTLSVGLHALEAALPGLGPWFKPGLANVMTLLALYLMGPRAAFMLAVARVVLGAAIIGTLFTPTFVMSLAGALSAATVMLATARLIPGAGPAGVSLLGAVAHMLAQFATVEILFIQQPAIYYLLPPLLLLAAATGWINGALADYLLDTLQTRRHAKA